MQGFLIVANLGALAATISAIYGSERRWVSAGYAALGFVIVVVMGVLLLFAIGAIGGFATGGVAAINNKLDTIGNGIQLAAPIAAAFGAELFGGKRKKP
jgi:hypothetical protein